MTDAQRRTTWVARLDNDYFAVWQPVNARPDHNYTQGLNLAVFWPSSSPLGNLLANCSACQLLGTIAFGQEIYTPEIDAQAPQPGQRPYAGWLAAAIGLARVGPGHITAARVVLGVTGPPSLAEAAQVGAHRLLGYREPLGWAYQLPAELGSYAEYEFAKQVAQASIGSLGLQLAGGGAARVGTVHVDGRATARVAVGVHPTTDGRTVLGPASGSGSLFVWVAGHVDGVLRNEFLQGTTFRSSAGVSIRHLVPEVELGVSARLGEVRVSGAYLRRGREYPAQMAPHGYVRLTAALLGIGRGGA